MNDELIKLPYEKPIDKALEFLDKILGPPAEEVGLFLRDKVRFWRAKNQVNIIMKAKEYCDRNKIEPKLIPIKTLVPLLEYGSLEEDPSLQEKWASLLAHAVDPSFSENIISSYAQILSQLSTIEVSILDKIFAEYEDTSPEKKDRLTFSTENACKIFNIPEMQFKIILGNLTRLHIVEAPASHGGVMVGKYPIVMRTDEIFQLTTYGYDFIKQCKYK